MINLANESKAAILETTRADYNACYVRLYTNSVTLNGSQTAGSFSEPNDSGYLSAGNVSPAFGAATLNGSNKGEMVGPPITWTFSLSTGTFTIYGYYVYEPGTGKCRYADDLAGGPVTITTVGETYTVVPKYTRDTA